MTNRICCAPFGETPDGQPVRRYTLRNRRGVTVRAIDYGGIVTSIETPDRDGCLADIVLGFDALEPYLTGTAYFGALIGRYGNRIARGRFTLDGATYRLATNDGPNHLHGGVRGFDKLVWDVEPFERDDGCGLVLRYVSPDGEEGYPGTLVTTVTYTLTDEDELILDYHASTDRATPVNLTHHSYFNLAGAGSGDVLGQELTIAASAFTPVDASLIPTGEIRQVAGTPFDFRVPTPVGARIDADDTQISIGCGYDHNFVLDRNGDGLALAARLVDPVSGRTLEIHTTEPGLHLHSGNFLDGSRRGRDGRPYGRRSGLCLEIQHFPDSPNHPGFPSTILRPGETLCARTAHVFGTACVR
jgi:aldose 1-epimerase